MGMCSYLAARNDGPQQFEETCRITEGLRVVQSAPDRSDNAPNARCGRPIWRAASPERAFSARSPRPYVTLMISG